jgi:hypothetical protein
MHAHPRGGACDDDGPIEVGTEGVAQSPQSVDPCQVVGRQRRHGDQLAQRRDRLT